MTLRYKTLIIAGTVFAVVIAILAITLRITTLNAFSREETRDMVEKVELAHSILDHELANLQDVTTDWAKWDDTYAFMEDFNQAYIDSNLPDSTFNNNRLNLIVYLNSSGEVVVSKSYSISDREEIPVPAGLAESLGPYNPLVNNGDGGTSGILALSENCFMVASFPILMSDGEGPARGTLIFGREIDSVEIPYIAGITQLQVTDYHLNTGDLPADIREVSPGLLEGKVQVKPLSADSIAGYTFLTDLYGSPVLVLKVQTARLMYSQASANAFNFTLSLIAAGILFATFALILLDRLIIAPLTQLQATVHKIGDKADVSARIPLQGKDEMSELADNINVMLEKLERSKKVQMEKEDLCSAILDNSPTAIIVFRIDGSIKFVNPAFERITGYTSAQLVGRRPPFPWWMEENIQQYMMDFEETLRLGSSVIERHFQRLNNDTFWVELNCSRISVSEKDQYVLSTWIDITQRMKAEKELRLSEQRFRRIAENAKDVVYRYRVQPDIVFEYVSPSTTAITGYTPEEYYARPTLALEATHPDDIPILRAYGESPDLYQKPAIIRWIHKNGSVIWTEQMMTPIYNEEGKIVAVEGIARDITERKKIEEELKESQDFTSSLLDNAPNPILVVNTDSTIRYVNPALERLTGFSAAEVIGKNTPHPWWSEGMDKNYTSGFQEQIMHEPYSSEARLVKKNGDYFWASLTSIPVVRDGKTRYLLSSWIDITESKQAKEELQHLYQSEKELREALEVEISKRTEFTRALVHELKTPLTPVLASSELLMEELKGARAPLPDLVKNISQGANNLNRRVDELLDLAKSEIGTLTLDMKPVDLLQLLHEVVVYMEPIALSGKLSLESYFPPSFPLISADEDRLRQILLNLLNNAVKYTSEGGKVILRAREEENSIVVEVEDNGSGMDTEEQKRLFQPYYRLERDRERFSGLGLGLALSKMLVELHGGAMWVKSRKGEGSIFSFSIPKIATGETP
jgi:PAS domain S-box-containing protein